MPPAQGFRGDLAPVLAAVQAASTAGVVLKLGAVAGAPLMPSMNGWLLGYPVVYLVDEGSVDAAAEALSHAPLLLVRALAVSAPGVRPCTLILCVCPCRAICIQSATILASSGTLMQEQGAHWAVACRPYPLAAFIGMSYCAEESCYLMPTL